MSQIVNVIEYKSEDFAIVEDQQGKFIVTQGSPEIIPIPDEEIVKAWFGNQNPCALLQSRAAMLT